MRVMQFYFCMASEPACLPGPKAWHIVRPPVLASANPLVPHVSFVTEPSELHLLLRGVGHTSLVTG